MFLYNVLTLIARQLISSAIHSKSLDFFILCGGPMGQCLCSMIFCARRRFNLESPIINRTLRTIRGEHESRSQKDKHFPREKCRGRAAFVDCGIEFHYRQGSPVDINEKQTKVPFIHAPVTYIQLGLPALYGPGPQSVSM